MINVIYDDLYKRFIIIKKKDRTELIDTEIIFLYFDMCNEYFIKHIKQYLFKQLLSKKSKANFVMII